jgi:sigma-B regulation protein RsbU (phosphoserine phosphatase)
VSGSELLLDLHFEARAENLRPVREQVCDALARAGCRRKTVRLLVLAVNEACMNVIQHGYRGDPQGEIDLRILNNDGELEFRLQDSAEVVDPQRVTPRPLDSLRPGGLGTHFIREIMDDYAFHVPAGGTGNLLIMKKRLKAGEASRHAS